MAKRRSSSNAGQTTSATRPLPPADDTRSLPARLLEMQGIARVVPALNPETLQKVLDHSGLEATLPLLALTSREQLHQVMDLDLWRSNVPGLDEGFDVDRFGEWLESLVEIGDEFAADLLARMEPTLIVGAVSALVRVFDLATLPSASGDGDDFIERTSGDQRLYTDVGGYRVVSRDTGPWDAIVAALVTLDAAHPQFFHRVMRGCRQLSNAGFERDGLDSLLDDHSQAWLDQHGRRLVRREARGYVAPAEARAFLRASRVVALNSSSQPATDPTWQAFLRTTRDDSAAAAPAPERASALIASADNRGPTSAAPDHASQSAPTTSFESPQGRSSFATEAVPDISEVMQLLDVEGVVSTAPRAPLESGQTTPERYGCLRARMQRVLEHEHDAFELRNVELSFLANVVAVGCPVHQRRLTPTEATEAATAVCNLGLEAWPRAWTRSGQGDDVHPPLDVLRQSNLITAFQVGWRTLADTVTTFASERLLGVLASFSASDHPLKDDVLELRWRLSRCLKDGEPWRAADELDVLAAMDLPAWATLIGLIAEFPVMHPVLTIEPGRRVLSVDPLAFTYFSEPQHLLLARRFLDSLTQRLTT